MNLEQLDNSLIDDRFKGIPGGVEPFPLKQLGQQGWNVLREDLPLPLAVLKRSAVEHNSRWMRRFLQVSGARLSPHGKTTMSPQLYQRQLADGAWGITLATADQVQIARRFGVSRVLLANQLVGRQSIDYVVDELARDAEFELLCLVDSVAGVQLLADAVRRQGLDRPLEVLVEGGLAGERSGCRDLPTALAVARAVGRAAPHLSLRGVEGFEGVIGGATPGEVEEAVRAFIQFLAAIARACADEQLFGPGPIILTAGGSAYYDLVAQGLGQAGLDRPFEVILRSGCYLTHDSVSYQQLHQQLLARSPQARELGPGLQPALEVWSCVQSRPEPQRAVLTMGKRDCSYDITLPLPTHWFRPGLHQQPQPLSAEHSLCKLNDQHAMLDCPPDSPLEVGDLVASGISHPCTTFDRWQLIPMVDDQYNVVEGIRTFF